MATSSSTQASAAFLTPVETALKESLLAPDFRDVHLYAYSKRTVVNEGSTRIFRPLPVVAIAHILKQTEYFSGCMLLPPHHAHSNS